MKKIKITTQEEFDNLPKSFDESTYIDIYSSDVIAIKENIPNSVYRLYGSSSAVLYDSSSAELYHSCSARLYDSSSAELYHSSSARLYDSSSAELYHSSSAVLYDSSSAELFQESTARKLSNNSTIKAYENSTVIQQCNYDSNIEIYDNAIINPCEAIEVPFDTWLERGYVVADGIYQKYISHKELDDMTIYKTDKGFVARRKDTYAHGETEDEARLDLRFKLSSRDKSEYESWNLNDVKTKDEMILAYRVITGACKSGTRDFVNSKNIPDKLKVKDAIDITTKEQAYGSGEFYSFFMRGAK
jgi:hypothetical protein